MSLINSIRSLSITILIILVVIVGVSIGTPYNVEGEQEDLWMVIPLPQDEYAFNSFCVDEYPFNILDEVDIEQEVVPNFMFRIVKVEECNITNIYYDNISGQTVQVEFTGVPNEPPQMSINWIEFIQEKTEETAYGF